MAAPALFFFFSAAEENEAAPFLREAANTLNIRKSFQNRASSKLNRGELFGRGSHFLHPTPSFSQSQLVLISLYKWKLNHCIPGWKMIGNESMSEVETQLLPLWTGSGLSKWFLQGHSVIKGLLWPWAESSPLFSNLTLKEREEKEKPGCPSLNRDVSSGRRGSCSCLWVGGCRQHKNCLKSVVNTGTE